MMLRPARFLLVLLLPAAALLAPAAAWADVFSIWPFGGSSTNSNGAAISPESAEDTVADLLAAKRFWTEKVEVNGQDMTMTISLSDQKLQRVRASVLKTFPDAQAAGNESSLLIRRPMKDGSTQRIFLLQLRGLHPLLQFSTTLPKDMPKNCPTNLWPDVFPRLPGASSLQLMKFPNRGASFGTYELPKTEPAQILDDLAAKIKADGWAPATAEHTAIFEGTGEVFMKESPASMLLLGVLRDSTGAVQVSFYTRKVK